MHKMLFKKLHNAPLINHFHVAVGKDDANFNQLVYCCITCRLPTGNNSLFIINLKLQSN